MTKRVIAVLLIVALVSSVMPAISVNASASSAVKITAEDIWAAAGTTARVNISVTGNPGIIGGTLTVSWPDELVLVDDESGVAFDEITYQPPSRYVSTGTNFLWYGSDVEEVIDGTILTLTFEIPEDAQNMECYEIKVNGSGFMDRNETRLTVEYVSGSISIVNYLPGDVSGNDDVEPGDLVMLARYISDGCITDPDGYNVSLNDLAADVNDDGRIEPADLILISRYISDGCVTDPEGYNVILKPSTPRCKHTMETIPYKAPTCTEAGNVEYCQCTSCGKYFNSSGQEIAQISTVIAAKGHTAVTDPYVAPTYTSVGWTEGSHCSTCDEVLVPQIEIPILVSEEYTITYKFPAADSYLTQIGAEKYNTNPTTYKADVGIEVLEDLEVPGYDFFGWYTEPNGGGQRISSIPTGTTGKKTLYAYMTPHVYKITFDTPDVDVYGTKITGESVKNYAEYTVDTGVTLTNPTWYGYTFVGWSTDEGFLINRIKPGTTGNITLHANWTSNRNKAVSYQSYGEPIIIEDAANGQFLFVYNIGKIENVPLNEVKDSYFHNMDTTTFSEELKVSSSVNEGFVQNINSMISNATTKSSGWTLENGWEDIYTSAEESGHLSETSDERTTEDGTVVGGKYFVSNSEGGSSYVSNESGGSFSNSAKVTTENSFGINESYDTATEKYCAAEIGVKNHVGVSNETEVSAGVEVPAGVAKVSAGVKNTTTVEASTDTETNLSSGRKDNEAYHIDSSVSGYVGTVQTKDSTVSYSSTVSSGSNWNTETGYEESQDLIHNEKVTEAIKEQLSEKSSHSMSKALTGGNSTTEGKEESTMNSKEYGTSFTYNKETTEETTKKVEQKFTVPGYYRYITAGTVHVYGVVGYDVATASYYTYCFNVLDDNTRQIWDYSKDDREFMDCENGVVTFDVPYEINEYVAGMIGRTNGLEIGYDGVVSAFEPEEDFNGTVLLPQYASKDNHDGTYTFAKVNSFAGDMLADVKDKVKVVVLPMYVTEIPDNAFAGCTNLKMVIAYGVTKIGDNAFAGCTSLEKFYVDNAIISLGRDAFKDVPEVAITAYDSAVAAAAVNCGAKRISLNVSYIEDTIDNMTFDVPATAGYFALIGNGSTYNNVTVKSAAAETMISNMVFANNKGTPIELTSSKAIFARMEVKDAPGFAAVLKADHVDLKLLGEIKLSSSSDNVVISRSAALSKQDQSTTSKLVLSCNYLVCGEVANTAMLSFDNGELVYLDEAEYEAMLTSSIVTFDPNEGEVDVTEKLVYYNQPYGELPMPTRMGYAFAGWYTAKDGGTEVTAETVATVLANQTLYARWEAMAYNVSWDTGIGYGITVNRTESPYANASTGELDNGAVIYYGDELEIAYTAETGYNITGNGSSIITVTDHVTASNIYCTVEVNQYTATWNDGTGYTITVERTSSPLKGAATGDLNSGAEVYYGDVLNVTYTANTGYTITDQGSTSITVIGNVTADEIYASTAVNAYTVSWDTGTGYEIEVERISSPNADAAAGNLNNGDTIYYGDELSITYTACTGYSLGSKGSTSITVVDNVTKDHIYTSASPNSYTYKIVYESINGTALGSSEATYKFATTNVISAPAKNGYNTPGNQTIVWDATSKTIVFKYAPTSVSYTVKTGTLSNAPKVYYRAEVQFRNRTTNSIQMRVVWTDTMAAYNYNAQAHQFDSSFNGVSAGRTMIAPYYTWQNSVSYDRSATGEGAWVTVSVGATTTSMNVAVSHVETNIPGTVLARNMSETWTVTIPTF